MGPCIYWSTIVFRASQDPRESDFTLPELRLLADGIIGRPPLGWGHIRGPHGATYLSLGIIGWSWTSPFMFTSKDGEEYPLTTTSPAMLRRIFETAWQDQLADQAAAKIGVDAIDLSHAVAAVKNKHLDRKDRSLLISFLTQSIWILIRLKEAGYETETTCICGAPEDHISHSLLECPATETLGGVPGGRRCRRYEPA